MGIKLFVGEYVELIGLRVLYETSTTCPSITFISTERLLFALVIPPLEIEVKLVVNPK